MINDSLVRFLDQVRSDNDLKQSFIEAKSAAAKEDWTPIVALAAEQGYSFTADDFQYAVDATAQHLQSLTVDELDLVTGGARRVSQVNTDPYGRVKIDPNMVLFTKDRSLFEFLR